MKKYCSFLAAALLLTFATINGAHAGKDAALTQFTQRYHAAESRLKNNSQKLARAKAIKSRVESSYTSLDREQYYTLIWKSISELDAL